MFIKCIIKPHFKKWNHFFLLLLFLCLKLFLKDIHANYMSPGIGCTIGHCQSDMVYRVLQYGFSEKGLSLPRRRVETESGGTRRSTGGEVKGKEANGVGSQQSCTVSEHGLSSITTANAHTSAASSRLDWHPRRYKWTRPFRWKTKSGFCACAITFRFHSNSLEWSSYILFCPL